MRAHDRRSFLRVSAMMAASAMVGSACSGSSLTGGGDDDAGGPVKIGLLLPTAGVYKTLGDDQKRGWDLYLELHGGKLGGRQAEVVTADEGEAPEVAKAGAEKLLKRDKVSVACGVISSGNLVAIQPMFAAAKVPFISTNASPANLQGKPFGWRSSFVNDHAGIALGKYVAEQTKGGKVALIAADYPAGKDYISGFHKSFDPAGGQVAGETIWVPFPNKGSFQPYLSQIRALNPTAVYGFFAGQDAVKFVQEYYKFGLSQKAQLYAPGFLTEGSALTAQGDAAERIFTALHYAPDLDNPANRTFVSEYQRRHNEPPTCYALAAYDAAWVLDKAIGSLKGDFTPEALDKAIGEVGQVDSPRGAWEFGKNRSPVQEWYLRQVRRDGDVLANVVVQDLVTLGDDA